MNFRSRALRAPRFLWEKGASGVEKIEFLKFRFKKSAMRAWSSGFQWRYQIELNATR